MKALSNFVTILLFFCTLSASAEAQLFIGDTASINRITREAYINARRSPDKSIRDGYLALSSSDKLGFLQGRANASLALGMAFLAKYNPGDSATFYNMQALNMYRQMGDVTGQARACYALSYVYSFKGDLQESEKYGELSLKYFEVAEDRRGMINALSVLIYLARQSGNNDEALDYSDRAIKASRAVYDTNLVADAINTRGNIFKDMLLYNEAIDSYFEALDLWQVKSDSAGLAIAYGSIGLMYYYQEEYSRALEFNFMKLPLSLKSGNIWEVSKTMNNISQIYSAIGMHDSSLFYLSESLKLNEKMNLPQGIAGVCSKMASTYINLRMLDSASLYINRAITIAQEIDDPEQADYLVIKGHVLKREGRYNDALETALQAYQMVSGVNNPEVLAETFALMSEMYYRTGDGKQAYEYLVSYHNLKDSITNNEYLKRITRLEIENEYNRKLKAKEYEQEQALVVHENKLQKQKLFVRGLAILIVLITVILVLYIRQSRLKSKYLNIDLEQRLMRAQMNPHFIFNSLCAVQDLILAKKLKKANAFLVKIASLMRNILENSGEEYISLDKEIETLKLYLDVQQLRFDEEFDYKFNIDSSIDIENLSVPPMLGQPCLENSIEHGLLRQKRKGYLEVSYTLKNDLLMLEVTDNGVGRKMAPANEDQRIKKNSISTRLTQRRLNYFRKTLKKKEISYEIIDLYNMQESAGTKVVMLMPCKKIFA